MLILWVILTAYILVALVFFILITVECQNREVNLNLIHFIVPLIWPLWALWYLYVLISDWFKK
jgi:hypothetical protein